LACHKLASHLRVHRTFTIKTLLLSTTTVRVRVTLRLAVYCQSVPLGGKPLETHDQYFFSTEHLRSYSLCNILSEKRMGLSFTIAAGPRQRSYSRVRVPQDSWPYSTVSDSRLLQPGGPGLRIYIPQEQGGPVIPPSTGFPFLRLLRLARRRWRYSNPPPHGFSPTTVT
jgi:hypothetical protein